jgi:hypothetical protein
MKKLKPGIIMTMGHVLEFRNKDGIVSDWLSQTSFEDIVDASILVQLDEQDIPGACAHALLDAASIPGASFPAPGVAFQAPFPKLAAFFPSPLQVCEIAPPQPKQPCQHYLVLHTLQLYHLVVAQCLLAAVPQKLAVHYHENQQRV